MENLQQETETVTPAAETSSTDPLNTPELNQAAYLFSTNTPRMRALAKNMGGKALARVFSAVIEFPLSDRMPKFKDKTENELFVLSLTVLSAKATMMSAIKDNTKEVEELVTNNVVDEMLQQKTEGEQ